MQERYSCRGWDSFCEGKPYDQLPEHIGIRFEKYEPMWRVTKDPDPCVGYFIANEEPEDCPELMEFITRELAARGKYWLRNDNSYKPIFNLDYIKKASLSTLEKLFLIDYIQLWKPCYDIIGFVRNSIDGKVFFLDKILPETDNNIRSTRRIMVERIPENRFMSMEVGREYSLEELGITIPEAPNYCIERDDTGVYICKELKLYGE